MTPRWRIAAGVIALIGLVCWVAVGAMAFHFIVKYW